MAFNGCSGHSHLRSPTAEDDQSLPSSSVRMQVNMLNSAADLQNGMFIKNHFDMRSPSNVIETSDSNLLLPTTPTRPNKNKHKNTPFHKLAHLSQSHMIRHSSNNNNNNNNNDNNNKQKQNQQHQSSKSKSQLRFIHSESDLQFYQLLGKGSFGQVKVGKIINPESPFYRKSFAIKILDEKTLMKSNSTKYLNIEKQVFNSTRKHPFICHLYFTFQTNSNNNIHSNAFDFENKIYMGLDLCKSYNLWHIINKCNNHMLSESLTINLMSEVVSALQYMHSKDIFHRDIKPENILITNGNDNDGIINGNNNNNLHIKLTDFGTCKIIDPILKKKILKNQQIRIRNNIIAQITATEQEEEEKKQNNNKNTKNGKNNKNKTLTVPGNNDNGNDNDSKSPEIEWQESELSKLIKESRTWHSRESLLVIESNMAPENRRPSFVGTPQYMPVEMVQTSNKFNRNSSSNNSRNSNSKNKNRKSEYEWQNPIEMLAAMDFWALGCVIYQCLVGSTPFDPVKNSGTGGGIMMNEHSRNFQIFQNIEQMDYVIPDYISKDAKNIIKSLLHPKYKQRLGMSGYAEFELAIEKQIIKDLRKDEENFQPNKQNPVQTQKQMSDNVRTIPLQSQQGRKVKIIRKTRQNNGSKMNDENNINRANNARIAQAQLLSDSDEMNDSKDEKEQEKETETQNSSDIEITEDNIIFVETSFVDSGFQSIKKHLFFNSVKSWDWTDLQATIIPFGKELDLNKIEDIVNEFNDENKSDEDNDSQDSDFGRLVGSASGLGSHGSGNMNIINSNPNSAREISFTNQSSNSIRTAASSSGSYTGSLNHIVFNRNGSASNNGNNNNNTSGGDNNSGRDIYARWKPFLKGDENIVLGSAVERSKYFGMSIEKYILLLTSNKRLLMIDGMNMKIHKEYTIARIRNMKRIDNKYIEIVLRKKTVKLKVMGNSTTQWIDSFRKVFNV